MNFGDVMRNEQENMTRTENGALALKSTQDACLDLFATIGALRGASNDRMESLFEKAYGQNPLLATKILFYCRDIREGLGERETFRKLLVYLGNKHPEALIDNLDLIGFYGRFDDLYCLVGTQLESCMWEIMKHQFEEDLNHLRNGKPISMLAKWIKTADAGSKQTRELGILTAEKLGYSVYEFKRLVREMRKHIKIVESFMVQGKWDEINYSEVPGRAMMIYRNAFINHDRVRFDKYITNVSCGVEKINASTLFPYDIVEKMMYRELDSRGYRKQIDDESARVLEVQWNNLPDYVEPGSNVIVVADVSGSMSGRPMASSIGLALYFAERNTGDFHNLFMTFSNRSDIVSVKGTTLVEKIIHARNEDWGGSTNLESAFERILNIAVRNHTPVEDMPKSIIVISDMEINGCTNRDWMFYDEMKFLYESFGYELPNIIFWNVNSRNNVFHVDKDRKGVQLCSGQSVTIFKQLISCIGKSPVQWMNEIIHVPRYDRIRVRNK